MPHGSTKFQVSWLDQNDIDGFKIGDWCTSCKTLKKQGLKDISVKNSGLPQIQQHAKGEKHRKLSQARFSQTQRHFVLSATCGESRGKHKVPVNVPIQDMSQQEKVTTAEALWAMKTSSSDF